MDGCQIFHSFVTTSRLSVLMFCPQAESLETELRWRRLKKRRWSKRKKAKEKWAGAGWDPLSSAKDEKVAIAGAAITSAPIVIPPLLLFTTVGLALSFPFGVYFASFACTDKVMSSLLSSPMKVAVSDEEDGDVSEGEVLRGEEAGNGEIVEVVEEEKPIEEMQMREEREGKGHESVDNTALESERVPPSACLYVTEANGGGEMVEEGESMKEVGHEKKRASEEDGEERDGLAVEAAEIELLLHSEDTKERDIKKVEGEKHVEGMGMEEGKNEELVGATILGAASIVDPCMSLEPENMAALCSDNASPVDVEGERGVIEIVEEDRPIEVQREAEEKENKEAGVGTADTEELLPSYYPFVALEPGITHGSDDFRSGHASMIVEKGDGEVIGVWEEVKGNERMGEEGEMKKRMEEQVVAAAVSEGEEPLQITCASVALVLEEHGIEIETSSLSSENATAVKDERIMESRKIVEKEQSMKQTGMGEKKKANEQVEETEDVTAATATELKKQVERAYPVVPMANANPSSDTMEGEQPTKGAGV